VTSRKDDHTGWIDFADWVRISRAQLEELMPKHTVADEVAWLRFRMALLGDD